MYVVTVTFKIYPNHIEDFKPHMQRQAENSLALEEACSYFDVCYDPGDGNVCFLYEIYRDEAAFQTHLQSDHFKAFDQTVGSWVESKEVKIWHLSQ